MSILAICCNRRQETVSMLKTEPLFLEFNWCKKRFLQIKTLANSVTWTLWRRIGCFPINNFIIFEPNVVAHQPGVLVSRALLYYTWLLRTAENPALEWRLWLDEANFQPIILDQVILDLDSHHVMPHGISALVTKTSFCGENDNGVAKCQLFSQCTALCILG